MDWQPPIKPAEHAESRLLEAILSGHFAINASLPGERDLAALIGVTRPTLREALQRLARDGWLEIQQGKPTRVRDYWSEGSLAVLATLARSPAHQPPDFISHLLELRTLLAPAYTHQAITRSATQVAAQLTGAADLADDPAAFAQADWQLHHLLTQLAANPVYRMLLNSFQSLYGMMAQRYFDFPECRQHSRQYYRTLLTCATQNDPAGAAALTAQTMQESQALWQRLGANPAVPGESGTEHR